jgi:peptidyl-prolyl cis-trans isomerase B (cyclophilin B)
VIILANPTAIIEMKNGGLIKLELYPDTAKNTVNNFIALSKDKFYDGLIFHRVISGFMIQGGCPHGMGTGGPGYSIKGEFVSNGADNAIRHERGVISMARSSDPNSAGSQFFIMHHDAPHLDGNYAAFGKVTEGMNVVDEIAESDTDGNDKPLGEQRIRGIKIELNGYEYDDPEKLPDM